MIAKSANQCAALFFERFVKLLAGEIIPGRNECREPYDSQWEQEFEWVLAKHIPDFFTLRNQVPFDSFRADFAFECSRSGRVWIIEFDGKAFHDEERDRVRDEIIFRKHPNVQAIVRVDAKTGHFEDLETQAVLSQMLPECFARQYKPRFKWVRDKDTFISLLYENIHDEDSFRDFEEAPVSLLKIQMKRRP